MVEAETEGSTLIPGSCCLHMEPSDFMVERQLVRVTCVCSGEDCECVPISVCLSLSESVCVGDRCVCGGVKGGGILCLREVFVVIWLSP